MSLVVKGLRKSFSGNPVLENVSFTVQRGEIVCLRGKSGEGKTTILRCLNGLESPDAGEVWIDGVKMNWQTDATDRADKIGLVFQNFNLFPHITILENLLLAPRLQGKNEEAMQQRAEQLLRTLGIEEKAKQYPFQLSGGQKQRAAIARACMMSPAVLCFDEPTSALDKESVEGICRIIQELSAQGMIILIVTHDEAFADRVAMRSIYLENGKVKDSEKAELEIKEKREKDRIL